MCSVSVILMEKYNLKAEHSQCDATNARYLAVNTVVFIQDFYGRVSPKDTYYISVLWKCISSNYMRSVFNCIKIYKNTLLASVVGCYFSLYLKLACSKVTEVMKISVEEKNNIQSTKICWKQFRMIFSQAIVKKSLIDCACQAQSHHSLPHSPLPWFLPHLNQHKTTLSLSCFSLCSVFKQQDRSLGCAGKVVRHARSSHCDAELILAELFAELATHWEWIQLCLGYLMYCHIFTPAFYLWIVIRRTTTLDR